MCVSNESCRECLASPATGASARLEIRVLGPVEVAWGGRPVDIGGVKARALMARLLIDRGLVVSVDRLVDSLWGDHDGDGAEIALRSTISRVRKRLRDAGAPEDLIVTRAPGYVLDAPAGVTDAQRFEQLVAEGRRQLSRRRPSEATMRLLSEAQELWRGQAYSEVRDEPFARAEARRLEELFLAATEARIDAELTLGRHEGLVGDLESLTSAHPIRERLWSQRMLALYRCGRQAEALRVYQDLRSTLVAELGIDPGHDVTWMEHAILTQDPALDFPVPVERDDETAAEFRRSTNRRIASERPRRWTRAPSSGAGRNRPLSATGGRPYERVRAASCWSTATPASGRPGWRPNWRAPSMPRARWCSGDDVTRTRWRRSSRSPRLSAGTSSCSRPTGSPGCRTGSSPSSPASSCV